MALSLQGKKKKKELKLFGPLNSPCLLQVISDDFCRLLKKQKGVHFLFYFLSINK